MLDVAELDEVLERVLQLVVVDQKAQQAELFLGACFQQREQRAQPAHAELQRNPVGAAHQVGEAAHHEVAARAVAVVLEFPARAAAQRKLEVHDPVDLHCNFVQSPVEHLRMCVLQEESRARAADVAQASGRLREVVHVALVKDEQSLRLERLAAAGGGLQARH